MEQQGLELSEQKPIVVTIEDRTRSELITLKHTFRPKDQDYLEYIRSSSPVEAELKLWAACIENVDDLYLWQGEPVTKRPDWKEKIPAQHKYIAARALVAVRSYTVPPEPAGV